MAGSDPLYLHLITICIGLIIAFALQQIVDLLLRRSRERKHKPPANPPTSPHPRPIFKPFRT